MSYWKHETAIIDDGAIIGDGTKIWHWTHVCARSRIGENCSFGQGAYVGNDVKIGNGVKVQNNVSIYDAVELEDDVFCGPSMVFTNVINPRAHISRKHEFLKTRVKKGATIGANATIVCGTTIGQYAFIAAGSVVTKNVADFALMVGVPAKQSGWMCKCGLKLKADLKESLQKIACSQCHTHYEINNSMCRVI